MLFLWRATNHHCTQLSRAYSSKFSGENSLEFLKLRVRKTVSRPLVINIEAAATLITSQIRKHREICSIIEGGHAILQPHFTDEEKKCNTRGKMTCPQSHSLIQNCVWNKSRLFLLSPVLFTPNHSATHNSVCISNDSDQSKQGKTQR